MRTFQVAVSSAPLPAPDDSTPPLGAALTPDEEVLSNATNAILIADQLRSDTVDQRRNGPAAPESGVTSSRSMALPEFRALAQKAALVLGTKSPAPGKAWLSQHYGTTNPAQLSTEQYEDAICRLRKIVNGSELAKPPTGSVPMGRSQAGAQPSLATPDAIVELDAAFERLGYAPDEQPARIRAFTGGRTDRPEEMTKYEMQSLLEELRLDQLTSA